MLSKISFIKICFRKDQYIQICYNNHDRENDVFVFRLVSVRKLTRFRRFTLNDQNFKLSQKWNIIGPFVFFFQRSWPKSFKMNWLSCWTVPKGKVDGLQWVVYLTLRSDPLVMILALKRSEISRKKIWTWRTGNKLKSLLFIRNETQRKYSFSSVVD